MKSLILSTATRYIVPMLLLFSAFLLLRGHNLPGGGFVGGVIAAAAYAFYGFAFGTRKVRGKLPAAPLTLMGCGLLIILAGGLTALLTGEPFLTGVWGKWSLPAPWELKLGTPLFFDIGVFLAVAGSTLSIILTLWEVE